MATSNLTACEPAAILAHAHRYLDQYGIGGNLEYVRARNILSVALAQVQRAPINDSLSFSRAPSVARW